MMRPGHASTMTLGIYNTPSASSTRPSSPYDPPTTTTSSQYLTIYLSNEDPTDALFTTDAGQRLYQSRTVPLYVRAPVHLNHKQSHNSSWSDGTPSPTSSTSSASSHIHTPLVTRVSRLYGSTARALRDAALKRGDKASAEEGMLVAEVEWLSRTRSSRLRFGDGLAVNKQNAVDVRVDEFLKSTNGRGFSKMFATSDGRTYKWKTDTHYTEPAHLVECDSGKRVSAPLVTFHLGGEVDGALGNGIAPSLRVATRLLPVIDQILVSWVIMEKERRMMAMTSPLGSSFPSPSLSSFSSSSSSSGLSSPSIYH